MCCFYGLFRRSYEMVLLFFGNIEYEKLIVYLINMFIKISLERLREILKVKLVIVEFVFKRDIFFFYLL